jgi:SpoVK/Ycf46/Vps4 family AAA+-type ATPase
MPSGLVEVGDLDNRPAVKTFTSAQSAAYNKIIEIIGYFFTTPTKVWLRPFRGFLLEGPPASGKTEVAWQVAKTLAARLRNSIPPLTIETEFIDSSVIAAPHWGEAEQRLSEVFKPTSADNVRRILLVDDIDGILITRGSEIAKEWHYSINSVIFHMLDQLDPTRIMIIATTNRPDLIDEALRSRLYSIKIPEPQKEELRKIARQMATELGAGEEAEKLAEALMKRLETISNPTLREIQHLLVDECIDSGLWRVRL